MERAEKLKEYLSEEKNKGNKRTAIGSNGKDTKSGGGKSKYVDTSTMLYCVSQFCVQFLLLQFGIVCVQLPEYVIYFSKEIGC